MEEKTYKIKEIEFKLNDDFDIDESLELAALLKKLYIQGTNIITADFTGDEITRFLNLVLIPVSPLPADFSFRKAKESVQLEVFKDFFLDRLSKMRQTKKDLANLIGQQNKPSEGSKAYETTEQKNSN